MLLTVLLGILLFVPLLVGAKRRSLNVLEPVFFWIVFYGYTYLGKPVVRVASGDRFWTGEENLDWAMAVAISGLLAFYGGYYSGVGVRLAAHLPAMTDNVSSVRLRRWATFYIVIGALGLWHYMGISGGWREFWSKPHGLGGKPELSTAYFTGLPDLMVLAFFLVLYDAMRGAHFRLTDLGRVFLASIGGVGVYTILWGRRTFVLWELITGFVLFFLTKGKRPRLGSLVTMGIVVVLALTLTLAYRPYLHLGTDLDEIANVRPLEMVTSTISQPGDEFDSFLTIVGLYPDRIDYDYFLIYARIPIHPIPRLIWPDKPPLFVSSWNEFLFQSGISWGASESVLGDLYIQMGIWGVGIGMFISGVLWRCLFAYWERTPRSAFAQLLYAVALGNMPSYVAQSAISAFWKWVPFMIPGLVVALFFSRERAKRQSTGFGLQARLTRR